MDQYRIDHSPALPEPKNEPKDQRPSKAVPPAAPVSGFLRAVQYLYFLRFSLLLLLAPLALAAIDRFTGINSITRGIFMPAASYDFVGEAFFLSCTGVIALITSRLVIINGHERYGVQPPDSLTTLLGPDSELHAGRLVFFYQVPALIVLAYLFWVAHEEKAFYSFFEAFSMGLVGLALAFIFWASLSIIYYWTAEDGTGFLPRTIVMPRHWFQRGPIDLGPHTRLQPPQWISHLSNRLAKLGPGYTSKSGQLFSGHQFAAIAAAGYALVYICLFPLTSPSLSGPIVTICLCLFAGITLVLAVAAFMITPPCIRWAKFFIAGEFLLLCVGAIAMLLGWPSASQTFPVLCSVLVLLSLLTLLVCAVAFLLDGFHIPVILATLAVVVVLHLIAAGVYRLPVLRDSARFRGFSDHYFNVQNRDQAPNLTTPDKVVDKRTCTQAGKPIPCPIIIVTATGGGIHAAAWTTEMLTELEETFGNSPVLQQNGYTFHNNVALFSTVSGGSVGLLPFLNEYYADQPFDHSEWQDRKTRMLAASTCSSLDAVAWGLEYRDFNTIMIPLLSGAFSPTWDRSNALEKSFHRHLFVAPCKPLTTDSKNDQPNLSPLTKEEKTLSELAGDLSTWADGDSSTRPHLRYVPAFSMNTTAAETGGRFLLSNYHVPATLSDEDGVLPAEDFLYAYSQRDSTLHPSILLSTAARLSATFPYVSSGARSDRMKSDAGTLHFVDGGYYDNDGIATAIEFLLAGQPALNRNAQPGQPSLTTPILVIEIRDGDDLNTRVSPEEKAGEPAKPGEAPPALWNEMGQLAAPLGAFWSAGHSAVSVRNRRELEVVMELLGNNHVAFKHIVLDYKDESSTRNSKTHQSSQPLSWSLTPSQVDAIIQARTRVQPCLQAASAWVTLALTNNNPNSLKNAPQVAPCALSVPVTQK